MTAEGLLHAFYQGWGKCTEVDLEESLVRLKSDHSWKRGKTEGWEIQGEQRNPPLYKGETYYEH